MMPDGDEGQGEAENQDTGGDAPDDPDGEV